MSKTAMKRDQEKLQAFPVRSRDKAKTSRPMAIRRCAILLEETGGQHEPILTHRARGRLDRRGYDHDAALGQGNLPAGAGLEPHDSGRGAAGHSDAEDADGPWLA